MRPSSIQWRIALIGGGVGVSTTALLALLIALAIAVAAEDRVAAVIIAMLSSTAALLCLLASGVFSLDALQLKRQVLASVSSTYTKASIWVIIELLLSSTIFMVLAISAFRATRALSRAAARTPASKRAPMVVGPAVADGSVSSR
jgi:hypothetical protein